MKNTHKKNKSGVGRIYAYIHLINFGSVEPPSPGRIFGSVDCDRPAKCSEETYIKNSSQVSGENDGT